MATNWPPMAAALHLLVRLVHLLGMAVVLGGALFTWNALHTGEDPLPSATRYEWVFWGALGAMLVTGVGNLGALGAPPPGTRWGTILTAKLSLVVALVVVSFLRTLVVLGVRTHDRTAGRSIRRLYAATVWVLLVVVGFAEVLAHG